MGKTFRQIVKDFFSPDTAEVNLGAIKLKYTDAMRQDVSQVLGLLREKRVLFANTDHEIWQYVFASLTQLRSALATLDGKLIHKGPNDVKHAVEFMVDVINGYLTEHEMSYVFFMQDPRQQYLAPAHREKNWPALGQAAEDLLALRRLLHHAIKVIDQYASTGEILNWEEPSVFMTQHWIEYARGRRLCPVCGSDLNYSYDGECNRCPNSKTVFRLGNVVATNVALVGTFNGWQPLPLHRQSYTEWIVRIQLNPGKHLYKFLVDGAWVTDPQNPSTECDDAGNENSVLRI